MANRKRHARRTPPPAASNRQAASWFCGGLATGALVASLVALANWPSSDAPLGGVDGGEPKTAADSSALPEFKFYTVLRDREVKVPDVETATSAGSAPQTDATPNQHTRYLIQAGSFKQAEDADRLRAELLLLGLDAKVQSIRRGEQTWHRVQIGPFASQRRVNAARNLLHQHEIENIVLRLRDTPAG